MAPKKFSPEFREQAVRAVIDSSRSVADVARELGVGPETLRNWVKAFRIANPDLVPAISESERVELNRLRKEIRELRQEREFLGKAAAFFAQGVPVNAEYAFTGGEEGSYSVRNRCRWAKVSTSGYHHWKTRAPSPTARRRTELGELIAYLFADSDGTYGYRRIHAALARAGRHADPQTIRSIMAERALVACQPRAKAPTTTISSDAGDLPDLVNRDFTADEPGHEPVADITYIRTWQGWVPPDDGAGLRHEESHRIRHGRAYAHRPRHRRPEHGRPQRPHPTRNHHPFHPRCRNAVHQ